MTDIKGARELIWMQQTAAFMQWVDKHAAHLTVEDKSRLFLQAILHSNLACAKRILELGLDMRTPTALGPLGDYAVDLALQNGKVEVLTFVLSVSNVVPLGVMRLARTPPCIYLLAERGYKVDFEDSNGRTALDCALENRYEGTVHALLDVGAKGGARTHKFSMLGLILKRRARCRKAATLLWGIVRFRIPLRYPVPKPLVSDMARQVWQTRALRDCWE